MERGGRSIGMSAWFGDAHQQDVVMAQRYRHVRVKRQFMAAPQIGAVPRSMQAETIQVEMKRMVPA